LQLYSLARWAYEIDVLAGLNGQCYLVNTVFSISSINAAESTSVVNFATCPSTQAEAIERLRLLVQSEDENVALKAIAIVVGKCAAISDGKLKSEIEEIKEWQAEQDLLGVAAGSPP
jgi:hypothetical protein